jgi:hypothetical protein
MFQSTNSHGSVHKSTPMVAPVGIPSNIDFWRSHGTLGASLPNGQTKTDPLDSILIEDDGFSSEAAYGKSAKRPMPNSLPVTSTYASTASPSPVNLYQAAQTRVSGVEPLSFPPEILGAQKFAVNGKPNGAVEKMASAVTGFRRFW